MIHRLIPWRFNRYLLLKILLTVFGLAALGIISQQSRWAFLALQRTDPMPHIQLLLQENRYAEAEQYLRYFMDFDYVRSDTEAVQLMQQITTMRENWWYRTKKIGEGIWTGSSDELIGQSAGLVTDFLAIGDLRDLGWEAVKYAKGEENDPVLIALASTGLLADAATVAASSATLSTAGAAAPAAAASATVNMGASALKVLRKVGKMPPWLAKQIIDTAKAKNIDKLKELVGQIGKLAKHRGGMKLVAESKNADELPKLINFAEKFGDDAVVMYEIAGKTAVNMAQKSEQTASVMKIASSYGQDGLKLLDNIGVSKFSKYSRLYKTLIHKKSFLSLFSKILSKIPSKFLYLIVLLSIAIWLPWVWIGRQCLAMINCLPFLRKNDN